MKCVIRVDSSTQVGSGHLMRCLTLAMRLHRDYDAEVHFVCRDLLGNLSYLISECGFKLHLLPRHEYNRSLSGYATWLTVSQEIDAQETKNVLEPLGQVDRLVVDSYALDISWESQMRPFVNEIFVIDDLANRKHDCDGLLDQNFYLDKEKRYDGLVSKECQLFLGPRYVLLREEFYEAKKSMRKRTGEIKNILVFYGGSDLTNETSKAIHALLQLDLTNVDVNVVVGGSNQRRKEIEDICWQHVWLHFYDQVNNMAELMNQADLMLGAGGTTTWERCFLGVPSLVTAVADNQVQICKDCHAAGLIEYVGFYDLVSEQDIVTGICEMTADKQKHIIDLCLRIFGEGGNI